MSNSESQNLIVTQLADGETQQWDAFVDSQPSATLFHLSSWRDAVARSCKLTPHYLAAKKGDQIVGILPLFHIKSLLFGNNLISSPFCMVGGPVGDTAAVAKLIESADQLARDLRCGTLELRNENPLEGDWVSNDLYCTFTREIFEDEEENLKAIPRKQRAMVRKGIKAGLQSRQENNLDNFFNIYATSVRNLGSPVFPRNYFQRLIDVFGERCEITTVFHHDMPVSSVMSFIYRDTVFPYYGGGIPAARNLKAYDFLYWEVMRRASEQGITQFDYGRSKQGSGSFSFKKNWGFEPKPLHYQFRLINDDEIPNRNPMSPKYQLAVSMWKKLPLPVANVLGAQISPYFA